MGSDDHLDPWKQTPTAPKYLRLVKSGEFITMPENIQAALRLASQVRFSNNCLAQLNWSVSNHPSTLFPFWTKDRPANCQRVSHWPSRQIEKREGYVTARRNPPLAWRPSSAPVRPNWSFPCPVNRRRAKQLGSLTCRACPTMNSHGFLSHQVFDALVHGGFGHYC